jgi:hypothetical protein
LQSKGLARTESPRDSRRLFGLSQAVTLAA